MKYIIHAYEKRMWYVNNFIIPQLNEQGIKNKDILVWNDKLEVGCLDSCMQLFATLPDNDENICHLQDDVLICQDFKKRVEKFKNFDGIVCGISVLPSEEDNETGETNLDNMWWSFPCIIIPNKFAKECSQWFDSQINKPKHRNWIVRHRGDDAIFKYYLQEKHPDVKIYNVIPNLVNHIDDLIGGGTCYNRKDLFRSRYWDDNERVEKLKRCIESRGKWIYGN